MPEKRTYFVAITCDSCIAAINGAVGHISNIKKPILGNIVTKTIQINYTDFTDDCEREVLSAINDVGFNPQLIPEPPDHTPLLHRGIAGASLGMALLILSLCNPMIPAWVTYSLMALNFAVMLYSGKNIYTSAFYKSKAKQLSMDLLFSVSATVAFAVSLASLFVPGMAFDMMMWSTAPLMFGFRNLGKYGQEKARQGVLGNINLFGWIKTKVTRIHNYGPGQTTEADYNIYKLQEGDVIRLEKDDYIPTDGFCLDNEAQINQVNVTGEEGAKTFKMNDKVSAGMQAMSTLYMRVEKPVKDSSLAIQQKQMQEAMARKAPIEEDAEKILKYFVPIIFLISIGCGLSIWFLHHDPFMALHIFLSIIAGACPCSLAIIVPLAVLMAWHKAKQHQLECYSAAAVDVADRVKFVSLDLRGTLTEGKPKVVSKDIDPTQDENTILQIAYVMERYSKHAVAKAICAEIEDKQKHPEVDLNHLPEIIDISKYTEGIKVTLKINGLEEKFILGNKSFLQDEAKLSITEQKKTNPLSQNIYLASVTTGRQLAVFKLIDKIRPDAYEFITQLKAMDKEVGLCTGSGEEDAIPYATELKIPLSNVKARCRGEPPKVKEIKDWQKIFGVVAHVGDNSNDQAGFAESNLGIIVKSGSTQGIEEKNKEKPAEKKLAGGLVEVKGDSLMPVLTLFTLSKQMHTFIAQVLCFSFLFNLCQVTVSEVIMITDPSRAISPGINTALMIGQVLLILLYAYRFKQQELPTFDQDQGMDSEGSLQLM